MWISHITVTELLCNRFLGVKDIPSLSLLGFGSIFPDWMEYIGRFRILSHRGISHNISFWLVTYLVANLLLKAYYPYLKWFLIGVFMHLAEDAMTKRGIPIFFGYSKRFALKLFITGGKGETIFVLIVIMLCLVA